VSDLGSRLRRLIRLKGPLSVAEFMSEALWHPHSGYYARSEVLGADGDYVTSPEISQMFGELLGLWSAAVWELMGRPSPLLLVELGPGRGTLLADALRAVLRRPDFLAALELHLVEASRNLEAAQRARLEGTKASWHAELSGVPEGPTIVLANEFLDALPILQLERTDCGWRERLVDFDSGGRFRFTLAPGPAAQEALLSPVERAAPLGTIVELSPAAIGLASALGRRVASFGGAALLIDYGRKPGARGPTLQALRRHARAEVLASPGSADLSAHVDFAVLARAAAEAGAGCHGPVPQGAFLAALGLRERAERLAAAAPQHAEAVRSAARRLTAPEEMGSLFQAFVIAHPALPAPPGFGEPT